MSEPLKCAVCKVVLTTSDAYHAVKTDAGLVHRECYSGPVAPPDIADDLLADAAEDPVWREAEEEARRDHNDVPLPDYPPALRNEQIARYRHLLNGGSVISADERSARKLAQMEREDLDTPLDPDARF